MLPNFIIVGAAKSGTTSLYHYLKEHPDIYMSPVKEINYFSSRYIPTQHTRALTIEDYASYFAGAANEKCIGECSPSYMYTAHVARDIKEALPDCKIIIIIRNPVDRMHSHFIYSRYLGLNSGSLSDFLHNQENGESADWFSKNSMLEAGAYFKQVKGYIDTFGKDKICIVTFDELQSNPNALMKKIYAFLDVDSSFVPATNTRHNARREPIIPWAIRLFARPNSLKRYGKHLVPKRYRHTIKDNLYRMVLKANSREKSDTLKEDDREYMLTIYRDDIVNLEKLIKLDLSAWLS